MKSELEKYGIQMPAFSKIGGILANELSVDEAACKRGSDVMGRGRDWDLMAVGLWRFVDSCFHNETNTVLKLLEVSLAFFWSKFLLHCFMQNKWLTI